MNKFIQNISILLGILLVLFSCGNEPGDLTLNVTYNGTNTVGPATRIIYYLSSVEVYSTEQRLGKIFGTFALLAIYGNCTAMSFDNIFYYKQAQSRSFCLHPDHIFRPVLNGSFTCS